MLPSLQSDGMLPRGVHVASMDEVVEAFGSGSAQRETATRNLQRVVELARSSEKLRRVFVWGSYVTSKVKPNDVDVMLVMVADFLSEKCEATARKVFDCEIAERELGATVLWVREDVPSKLMQMFLDQWQIGRDGAQRGIVELSL